MRKRVSVQNRDKDHSPKPENIPSQSLIESFHKLWQNPHHGRPWVRGWTTMRRECSPWCRWAQPRTETGINGDGDKQPPQEREERHLPHLQSDPVTVASWWHPMDQTQEWECPGMSPNPSQPSPVSTPELIPHESSLWNQTIPWLNASSSRCCHQPHQNHFP